MSARWTDENPLPMADIKANDFGGSPVGTHNMPCPVCGERKAVWEMSAGSFGPCWPCQRKGWALVRQPGLLKRARVVFAPLAILLALALAAWAVSCTQLPAEVEAGGTYPYLTDDAGRRLVPIRADWVEQSDGHRTYGMDDEPVVWIAEGAWR